ncbi:ABC transporter ATP-binding protein [uncultured Brevundimonas sp.]|uniref:ABC transporter ATP-binding protein n=1 Tax=uncultured Brevundimonas sp. TaxID=213418 RepID=UPI00260DA485|nr:ABC transporter ATP-binding protein [uncultured Brevundimonas sp.]
MNLLTFKGVRASLGQVRVLDGIDIAVKAGEVTALCGPNGAGKSSVIRAAAGLLPVEAGEVRLSDVAIGRLSPRQRAERVAYLPQERRIAWNLPAVEVAALGAPFLSGEAALAKAAASLEAVGAGHLADRGVADMSGGERARVLLARALTTQAPLMLADEPIAGLDPDAQRLVLEQLKARAEAGAGVLVSLHDLTLAAAFADRVIVLDRGRVIADAAPITALAPTVLRQVFGLDARWVEEPDGPLLAARRTQ